MTRKGEPDRKDKKAHIKWLMEEWAGYAYDHPPGCFGCNTANEYLIPFMCNKHYVEWLKNPKDFEIVADHLGK